MPSEAIHWSPIKLGYVTEMQKRTLKKKASNKVIGISIENGYALMNSKLIEYLLGWHLKMIKLRLSLGRKEEIDRHK